MGETPLAPCKDKEIEVHLGGGDVTGVVAGSGLSGGGSDGQVALGVDSSAVVTAIQPGFGLSGGGSGGDVTLAIDPTTIQRGVTTNCEAADGSIAKINEDGTAVCRPHAALGLVATLDAGTVHATGSDDPDLCDEGHNEGGTAGPFTSTAGPVHLEPGVYQAVPRGFRRSARPSRATTPTSSIKARSSPSSAARGSSATSARVVCSPTRIRTGVRSPLCSVRT